MEDQDSVYLTKEEREVEGYHAAISANMNGLSSSKAFQDIYFNHPQFGECIFSGFYRKDGNMHKKMILTSKR